MLPTAAARFGRLLAQSHLHGPAARAAVAAVCVGSGAASTLPSRASARGMATGKVSGLKPVGVTSTDLLSLITGLDASADAAGEARAVARRTALKRAAAALAGSSPASSPGAAPAAAPAADGVVVANVEDFAAFRPKSWKSDRANTAAAGAPAGVVRAPMGGVSSLVAEASDVDSDAEDAGAAAQRIDALRQAEQKFFDEGLESDDETIPPEDFDGPLFYTRHVRQLVRAYEAKDLDQLMALYYKNKLMVSHALAAKRVRPGGDRTPEEEMEWREATPPSQWFDDDAVPLGPNYLEYNIVLNACACAGRIDLVSSVLDDLYDQKGVATAQHFTIALKAAAVAGASDTSYEIWQLMKAAKFLPDVHGFAAAISAAMAGKKYERAFSLYNKMKKVGLEPTPTIYWMLFEGLFKDGRADLAVYVWYTISQMHVFAPDKELCDMIVKGFAAVDRVPQMQSAFARMRRSKFGGLTPTPSAYMAMFECYTRAEKFEEAASCVLGMAKAGYIKAGTVSIDSIKSTSKPFPSLILPGLLKVIDNALAAPIKKKGGPAAAAAAASAAAAVLEPAVVPVAKDLPASDGEEDEFFDRPTGFITAPGLGEDNTV